MNGPLVSQRSIHHRHPIIWLLGLSLVTLTAFLAEHAVGQTYSGSGVPEAATRRIPTAPPVAGLAPPMMKLKHLTPADLEARLQRLGGSSIVIAVEQNGRSALIQIREGDSLHPLMRVDRQGRQVELLGSPSERASWRRVITALDARPAQGQTTQLLPLGYADPQQLRQTMELIKAATGASTTGTNVATNPRRPNRGFASRILVQDGSQQPAAEGAAAGQPKPADQAAGTRFDDLSEVQIEFIPELGMIVLKGPPAAVARVRAIIEQIESLSQETRPEIRVFPLKHANSEAMATLIASVYEEIYQARFGVSAITALVKPNAILVVGRSDAVITVAELIAKLDQPVQPSSVVRVFHLKHMSSADAQTYLQTFYGAATPQAGGQQQQTTAGLAPRINVIADPRTNSLIVQASPRDMQEVDDLVKRLDVDKTAGTLDLRVFPLRNALADDLTTVLQNALGVQSAGQTGQGAAQQNQQGQNQTPNKTLQIIGVDSKGHRTIQSGILSDVVVTADSNTNSVVVRASPQSMPLIARLIEQLDAMPAAESQIKVFPIENGDATNLATMLQQLFGLQVTVGQIGAFSQTVGRTFGQPQLSQTAAGESSLIPLRFAVDARTNSIIATGSAADLAVVEAILVRLDEGDLRQRRTRVYRLNNAPAQFVSDALSQILQQNTQLLAQQQQQQFSLISQFEFIDAQVFVVPEAISNSLIVSATPDQFDQISEVIADLDRRPPMVMVQAVLARVRIDSAEELGVELGLQDSLLFDRSSVVNGVIVPGFNFIGQNLGSADTAASRSTRNNVGGQGFSSFNVGRSSAGSGFGGLVLSASSESVNILLRALEAESKLQILSRPQIMTLNNVPASILVGQRVPRVSNFQTTTTGTVNSVDLDEVGLSLGIIPRVSPDGLITMDVEIRDSSVGPVEEGIPIGVQDGVPINSPIFDDITAITTVTARTGQTIVFSGLISKEKSTSFRGVPVLSHIPIVGRLFRFDTETENRSELLIFLTPHIVNSGEYEDMARINQLEAERMSWCLADVVELHGDPGFGAADKGVFGPAPSDTLVPDGHPEVIQPMTPQHRPMVQPEAPQSGSKPFLVPPAEQRANKPFLDMPRIQPPVPADFPRPPQDNSSSRRVPAMTPATIQPASHGQWQRLPYPQTTPQQVQPAQYQPTQYQPVPQSQYQYPRRNQRPAQYQRPTQQPSSYQRTNVQVPARTSYPYQVPPATNPTR